MNTPLFTVIAATGCMGLALGLLFPVTPFFAQELGASIDKVALLFSIYSLCAMISAPFWGRFADKKGRKITLLIGALGGFLSYLWMAYATELWELFAARALAGCLSGWMAASQAFISDLSKDHQRTARFGLLGATFGIGITIGPAISASLMHFLALPFFPIYLLSAFTVLIGFILICFLHEPKRQRPTDSQKKSPPPFTSRTLSFLLPALCLSLAFTLIEGIFALWSAQQFSLSPVDVGLILTAGGFCAIVTQGGLIGLITRKFGYARTLIGAIILTTFGSSTLAYASSLPILLIGIFSVSTGIALFSPPFQTLLIQQDPSRSATLLGFNHSVSAGARVIGPALGGFTLVHISSHAPFFISAALALTSLLLWFLFCHAFAQKNSSTSPNTKDAS